MATLSSILAWRIPWDSTEEPGGLQLVDSQESDTTEGLSMHTRTVWTSVCQHSPCGHSFPFSLSTKDWTSCLPGGGVQPHRF